MKSELCKRSNKTSYGLQDILITGVKIQHLADPRNCKTQDHKLKRQHIMKFDGQSYIFNESKLLETDGI
ncbi:hypothetical protein B9T35_05720 [Acinetobacter sp. ANC 3832]|nr:hypothetical protein B9T35_05720 [Acinetobacter sp. ANC 3832]